MGSTSFWQLELKESGKAISKNPLHGTVETEVAGIGAGITGTATALWLARAGINVRVLETRSIASGASGLNGGFIAYGTTASYSNVIQRYGREQARRLWAFTIGNHELLPGLIDELEQSGWSCSYCRNGSMKLALSEAELEQVIQSASLLIEDGWKVQIVPRNDLPTRLQNAYFGGTYYPANGEFHPAKFVMGLALLAQQAGAVFHNESQVIGISANEDGILLHTSEGTIHARTLVLATNAWLPELGVLVGANWLSSCIFPTRGQVIATEPVNEQLFPHPCSADEGYQYWRQLQDGRLVVGGWRNRSFDTELQTYDDTPNETIQQHLDAFVHQTLNLPHVKITNRWAGIMGFTSDSLPLIGRLPGMPNCFIAGGYTGHGNAFAVHAAKLVSELVRGKMNSEAELFDPARFDRGL
ncbi:MAG: NAD(P)/FAD-dependent oxidoreductase [Ktedonobacteraceae bacterium]